MIYFVSKKAAKPNLKLVEGKTGVCDGAICSLSQKITFSLTLDSKLQLILFGSPFLQALNTLFGFLRFEQVILQGLISVVQKVSMKSSANKELVFANLKFATVLALQSKLCLILG